MSEIFVASTGSLEEIVDELMQLNNRYQEFAQEIVTEQKNLTQKWEGDASQAFQEHFNKEQHCYDDFYQGVDQYAKVLLDILSNYDKCETTNINIAAN